MLSIEHCSHCMLHKNFYYWNLSILPIFFQFFFLNHPESIKKLCFSDLLKGLIRNIWIEWVNDVIEKIFSVINRSRSSRGILTKRCSENMQQIYRRIPMPKCDFNKVAKQLYWNHTSAWVFPCKFATYFENIFL